MTQGVRRLLAVLTPLTVLAMALSVGDSIHNPLPFLLLVLVPAALPVIAFARIAWRKLRGRPLGPAATGTELIIWLMSVVAAVVVAVPLLTNVGSRARLAKAQADTRALASSVGFYYEHTGRLPQTLDALTRPVTNAKGQVAGPFIVALPSSPAGWAPYSYEQRPEGKFSISSRGGEGEVRAP